MKHPIYRILVFSFMFIVLNSRAVPVTAQDIDPGDDQPLAVVCPEEESLSSLLDAIRAEHPGYENPPIQGLRWHRTEYFSFFIPDGWQQSDWYDGRMGVLYQPVPDDPLTVFAVEVKDLGMVISPEALDGRDTEILDSIGQLADGVIELHEKEIIGELMQLDYRYTFRAGCVTRRRWVRVLYLGTRETTMMAQGATLDLYNYWLPWFFEAMSTAQVHDQTPTLGMSR